MYENVQIGGVTQTKHVYIHITDRPTHTHIMLHKESCIQQEGVADSRVKLRIGFIQVTPHF